MSKQYCKGCAWMGDALNRLDEVYSRERYECHHPSVVETEHDPLRGETKKGPVCTEKNPESDCPHRQTWFQYLFGINKYVKPKEK